MQLKDFAFPLPEELIAQWPPDERGSSRLMVMDRLTGELRHRGFADIKEYLRPGDLVILNDTRVMPARLLGRRKSGGKVELLLVEKAGATRDWNCLAKPSKGLDAGAAIFFGNGITAEVIDASVDGFKTVRFSEDDVEKKLGKVPLPPYIKREPEAIDLERYQTVFAQNSGAVAAPTAGLHFTQAILDEIKEMGVDVRRVTLHTGPGTFMPVRAEDLSTHMMPGEYYKISPEVFEEIKKAKKEKRRVVAVGTTSVRALEAAALEGFERPLLEGRASLFIYPGFNFKAVDALLTNFHLPCSTLVMLVAAFGGYDNVMRAYREAVKERYSFFSYGDAMLVI
ncbi:MAG: tRNA preQ1(34) S-adenosylmethionine ribosyltransferase-isomerase QueA [Deltaproteobacteria bacterium]|nr:tRNA preQ1(34) S-adenosylmethionine ribosyltransferase-isomerase QueA [Deltaproteobacteria bacterium]